MTYDEADEVVHRHMFELIEQYMMQPARREDVDDETNANMRAYIALSLIEVAASVGTVAVSHRAKHPRSVVLWQTANTLFGHKRALVTACAIGWFFGAGVSYHVAMLVSLVRGILS